MKQPRLGPSLRNQLLTTLSALYRNRTLAIVEHHPEYSLDVILELLEARDPTDSLPLLLFVSPRRFEENGVPSRYTSRRIKLPFLPAFNVARVKHVYDLPEVL
jgi:hypothetical protein